MMGTKMCRTCDARTHVLTVGRLDPMKHTEPMTTAERQTGAELDELRSEILEIVLERDTLKGKIAVALRCVRRAQAFLTLNETDDARDELKSAAVYLTVRP